MPLPVDPFEYVRRRFASELARQQQRLVDAVLSVPGTAMDTVTGKNAAWQTSRDGNLWSIVAPLSG